MNDFEEVRFGLIESERLMRSSEAIAKACGTTPRAAGFFAAYDSYNRTYIEDHLRDTYVFCLSKHDPDDNDGLLSMWRGYGGNGNGVAIVFETANLNNLQGSPLTLARVEYGQAKSVEIGLPR